MGLAVPLFGSLACLRRMVADEGSISPDQVIDARTDLMHAHHKLQLNYLFDSNLICSTKLNALHGFNATIIYLIF